MRRMTRRVGTLLLVAAGLGLAGCGNAGQGNGEPENKVGQLALPLVTQGASGTTYRLRDATFNIYRYGYWGGGGSSVGGGGGSVLVTSVSSETDPNAATISVSLEEGSYYLELVPGWHFEQQTSSGWEDVEATLLSGETQYVYVSRQSTSFAEFQFGLGGREIWLNGQLNIGVVLYEEPGGTGGAGGFAGSVGTAGSFTTAGFGGAAAGFGGSF